MYALCHSISQSVSLSDIHRDGMCVVRGGNVITSCQQQLPGCISSSLTHDCALALLLTALHASTAWRLSVCSVYACVCHTHEQQHRLLGIAHVTCAWGHAPGCVACQYGVWGQQALCVPTHPARCDVLLLGDSGHFCAHICQHMPSHADG